MNGKSRKGTDTKEGTTTNQPRNGATRKGVSVFGAIGGFVSIEHGIFEILQGNAELERFSKLAVGRELKMIELKKKVSEMESRRGSTNK
jgi:hypothetical protein